jgi:hypothetical protein
MEIGPATISIRYQQPKSQTWLNTALHVNIVPEERTVPLELGNAVPLGAALLTSLAPALEANGFSAPARCEPRNVYRESFTCFDLEESSGQSRYPSCRYTSRCEATHAPYSGFFTRVKHVHNSITSLSFEAHIPEIGELNDSRSKAHSEVQP